MLQKRNSFICSPGSTSHPSVPLYRQGDGPCLFNISIPATKMRSAYLVKEDRQTDKLICQYENIAQTVHCGGGASLHDFSIDCDATQVIPNPLNWAVLKLSLCFVFFLKYVAFKYFVGLICILNIAYSTLVPVVIHSKGSH